MYRLWILAALSGIALVANSSKSAYARSPLTWDEVVSTAQSRWVKTREDFLDRLPQTYRSVFPLVYASRSQEKALITSQFPRAIFGAQANLLMAANGYPGAPPVVELIRTNEQHEFEFYRADFSPGIPRKERLRPAQAQECFGCHFGRPIWDAYPVWPGIFGSMHGRDAKAPGEAELFRAFADSPQSRQGLYSKLIGLHGLTLEKLTRNNIDLTNDLAALNAANIAHLAMRAPNYRQWRAPLIAAFAAQATFSSVLPESLQANYDLEKDQLMQQARSLFEDYLLDRKERQIALTGTTVPFQPEHFLHDPYMTLDLGQCSAQGSAQAQLVLEQMGIDPRVLSLSLKHEPTFMLTGQYPTNFYFLPELIKQDPELQDIFPYLNFPHRVRDFAYTTNTKGEMLARVQALDRLPAPLPARPKTWIQNFCGRFLN